MVTQASAFPGPPGTEGANRLAVSLSTESPSGSGAGGPGTRRGDAAFWAQAARISLVEATERVRQATRGRVLDARDEGSQHRVKVLTPEGEVRVVVVDARTGAMR